MKQQKWTGRQWGRLRSPLRSKTRAAGVTLVELMTALSLLGSAAVVGWRELDGFAGSPASISAEREQSRRHESTFSQMEADCAHLVEAQTFEGLATLTVNQHALVLLRDVGRDGDALFQVVVYRNRNGTLTRAASAPSREHTELAAALQAALAGSDGFAAVVLESNLAALAMHTWSDGLDWRRDGIDSAPPESRDDRSGTDGSGTGGSSKTAPPRTLRMIAARTGLEVTLQVQGQRTALSRMFFLATG
jgi:general secretion pathway protein J